ncbi:MAG: HAD-IB family hydrolase [Deltaproteobacteria bacterium]|nr:HAD-IB family hydrolase [Deltaproteobacteria bacterium]HCH64795.1 HAD-IB family hydrolase [Deltaproteobacteria bacterium]
MSAIAFFDLDKTVLSINSARAWVRAEHRAGRLGLRDLVQSAWWLGQYRLGFARMDDVLRDAISSLEGHPVGDFDERVARFWTDDVAPTVRPGALQVIERHREAGDLLVLLTAASRQLADNAADALGFDAVLANELQVTDGRFTGRMREPLCYGDGKVHHATACAVEHSVDLSECTFYTDSYTDRLALEAVGHPVCVAPDPRLKRLAKSRGWRIEDWGRATA